MKKTIFTALLALATTLSIHAATDLTVNCGDEAWISATPATGYHFVKWDDGNTDNPRKVIVTSDLSFKASFEINTYTIRFVNLDGTELESKTVNHGVLPTYTGQTPTMDGTAKYTFDFRGWKPALHNADADFTYTADYDSIINSYQIKFFNYDGSELETASVNYGVVPEYTGETPAKPANAQYSYAFKGWKPALVAVTGDANYTADFDSTVNVYRIEWHNEDGTLIRADSVAYGATPAYDGATPTKAATAQYSYVFDGWTPAVVTVTGDAVYTATYQSAINHYDVVLTADNGVVTGAGNYAYGEEVNISVTANDCHHFTAWSDNDTNASRTITVTGNVTLNAVCEIDTFNVHVESANEGQGTVSVSLTQPTN